MYTYKAFVLQFTSKQYNAVFILIMSHYIKESLYYSIFLIETCFYSEIIVYVKQEVNKFKYWLLRIILYIEQCDIVDIGFEIILTKFEKFIS